MKNETFQEFGTVTYEAWKHLAEKTLKGKSFESIIATTYEGIALQPLYTREDGECAEFGQTARLFPLSRHTIAQELRAGSPDEANERLLRALHHGQTILHLVLDMSGSQRGDAIPIQSRHDLARTLKGIQVEKHPFLVDTGFIAAPFLGALVSYVQESGKPLLGTVGADPLGYLAAKGELPISLGQSYDTMADTIKWSAEHAPGIRTILVRTDTYHNAGAHAVQEMAAALATAVEYVRVCISRGLDAAAVFRHVTVSCSVGSHLFTEIAKLRAIRVLWKKIAESFGVTEDAAMMNIHARTSKRTKTVYDPHVNLLRATTEAFSAIVGGADTIHVSTYDEAYGYMNESSERLARNIQHILLGESHAAKVTDPARGSYYTEALTKELAKQAWSLFQKIEKAGGMSAVLKDGSFQKDIAHVAKQRYEAVVSLKQKIVGTNVYVKQDEVQMTAYLKSGQEQMTDMSQQVRDEGVIADVMQSERSLESLVCAFSAGATFAEVFALFQGEGETVQALPYVRDAEPIERLRAAAEKYEQTNGSRPQAVHIVEEHTKGTPFVDMMLEACGYSVAAGPKIAKGVRAVFLDGGIEGVRSTLRSLQEAYSGKIAAVGRFTEEEEKELLQLGVSACLSEAKDMFSFLYELHNELEVTV